MPNNLEFPPGLIGEMAQMIYEASPRPVPEIALAAAFGLAGGLWGRAWNVFGSGLNLYLILVAETGVGKEAMRSGIAKIINALKSSISTVVDFYGPSYFASSQAFYKEFVQRPCFVSILPEFGLKLRAMAAPHAPAHVQEMHAAYLDLYNLSGHGQIGAGMRYSDATKNVAPLRSPSITLLCESNPSNLFGNADESLVTSGLLPRFIFLEYKGDQVELNQSHHLAVLKPDVLSRLASTVAQAQSLMSREQAQNVELLPDAKELFDNFEKWTRREINSRPSEVARHLWTRAHLKAAKLAALIAVGKNYISPAISGEQAHWAIDLIHNQTIALIKRFSSGDIGTPEDNEVGRRVAVLKIIQQYINEPFEKWACYGVRAGAFRDKVIEASVLQRRLAPMALFRKARGGATNAFKQTIRNLIDAGDLVEIPRKQMEEQYGKHCWAFMVKEARIVTEEAA